MVGGPPKTVLMADDDTDDCMFAREAFAESGSRAAFSCVQDGIELMDHLAEHGGRGLPSLILLDLNMPRKNGREALIEIKAKLALQHIPIIILPHPKTNRMSLSA